MELESQGLTLFEAARQKGIPFTKNNEPLDRNITARNMNFHYLEWGEINSPTILMLHGNAQQAHSWDFISLALSDKYRIIALDQRGHGDSDWSPTSDYSTQEQVKDINSIISSLGLKEFHLVGHSMGGRNSYSWASQNSQLLKSLTIVDTGPDTQKVGRKRMQSFKSLPDELSTFEEFAERIQQYTGRPLEQVLGSLKYNIRQRSDGKWSWKYDKVMRDPNYQSQTITSINLWKMIPNISCPTLIIRGANSDVFNDNTMTRMQEAIPQCQIKTVPNAGHLVQGDNPVNFLEVYSQFLSELD
jgi:esterase